MHAVLTLRASRSPSTLTGSELIWPQCAVMPKRGRVLPAQKDADAVGC